MECDRPYQFLTDRQKLGNGARSRLPSEGSGHANRSFCALKGQTRFGRAVRFALRGLRNAKTVVVRPRSASSALGSFRLAPAVGSLSLRPLGEMTHTRPMALELRPNCELCDVDLPPSSEAARICSYECTFCAD